MNRRDFLKGAVAIPTLLMAKPSESVESLVRNRMPVIPTVRGITTFRCGAACKVHAFAYYVDPFESESSVQSKLAQIEHSAYMQYLSYKPEGENITTPAWRAKRKPIMVLRREWDRIVDKYGEKRTARFWFAHVQSVQIVDGPTNTYGALTVSSLPGKKGGPHCSWSLTTYKDFDYYWDGKPIQIDYVGDTLGDRLLAVPKGEPFKKYARKGLDGIE